MITWTCPEHGTIPTDEIHLLTWDSPHNEETHAGCGSYLDWEDFEDSEQEPPR